MIKNDEKVKVQKSTNANRKHQPTFGDESSSFSFSLSLFFPPFSRDFGNSYTAVPPSFSHPYGSPFSLSPVFLAGAGTFSPTSLSLSPSFALPQNMLSIFSLFFPAVPFICPFSDRSLPFFIPPSSRFDMWKNERMCTKFRI